jgi:enoyl-CoA hydratase/carnithine racemase
LSHQITIDWPTEHIAVISFQDPQRQNQWCWAAIDEMGEVLGQCRKKGARVLILASSLAGHWYEHAWLQDLCSRLEDKPMTGSGMGWFTTQKELSGQSIISIAAVSGDSSGGGAELGWACDFRVAERQARFSQPEIKIQLTPGIGGCSRLSRLVGTGVAAEMVMTGRPVSADRLFQLGAVNEVVDEGEALSAAIALAESLLENSWTALMSMKATLASGSELPLAAALEQEQSAFQSIVISEEARAGLSRVQARFDNGETIEDVFEYDNK